ncbi:MAG: hypothetical protein C4K60_07920 [Ideonella sp. MAG2]|nr:MAG: hypothetical protein C4K60_07920 [Ideonella sp. MAG2]
MKLKYFLPVVGLLALMACDGRATAKSEASDLKATTAAQAATAAAPSAYLVIDRVIQDPKVLRLDWSGMSKSFPAHCSKNGAEPELTCPPVEGIREVSVLSSGTGLIDWVLTRPVTCEDLYALIAKRYGQGTLQDGDKCSVDWNLSKSVKGAYIRLSKSRKQADKIFLQFGIEQGP